jgi:hypothetical protein
MQQRQPRLGDILDDYCPRERRLTNHAVVAMIGDAVKQTRCTTCEAEHEYKHAKVPRQRKKSEQSALYSQVLAAVTPKKVAPAGTIDEPAAAPSPDDALLDAPELAAPEPDTVVHDTDAIDSELAASDSRDPDTDTLFDLPADDDDVLDEEQPVSIEEGPAHRRLIRAQLPRHEGQVAVARQAPDFTIRQPATGRPNRFRPRQQQQQRGAQFHGGNRPGGGNAGNGNHGNAPRQGGRPQPSRPGNRHGSGRNRPK